MLRRLAALAASALLMAAAPVSAFTPESGFYWQAGFPGSGLTIEIQDNYVFLIGYVYDAQGRATWVTAQGLMPTVSPGTNSRFSGVLDSFTGGRCIGCAYTAPIANLGSGGPVTLNWTTEIDATLTWGGQTIPLTRFDYYLSRTGGITPRTELMLGEWQAVLDIYNTPNNPEAQAYPYLGEVLIFTAINTSTNPDQATGCRPTTSLDGLCTTAALNAHDASAAYSPIASGTFARTHVIVVTDDAGSGSVPDQYFSYYVTVGTSQFDGVFEVCNAGQCGQSNARLYPVRGFRSASRAFVQSGVGPSSNDKALASAAPPLSKLMRDKNGNLPQGLTVAEAKARFGIDVTLHRATVDALIAGQQSRR